MTDAKVAEKPAGKTHGSGNRTTTYYKVEVRTTYPDPTVLPTKPEFVIDNKWREIPIFEGAVPFGLNVPVRGWERDALEHGLVSHEVAEAHRHGFLAQMEAISPLSTICFETRLVAVEYTMSYSTKELGVSAPMKSPRRPWDAFTPREQ